MKVIIPGMKIEPPIPKVYHVSCHRCKAELEYGDEDVKIERIPFSGCEHVIHCPTPNCNSTILHHFSHSTEYTDEQRKKIMSVKRYNQ